MSSVDSGESVEEALVEVREDVSSMLDVGSELAPLAALGLLEASVAFVAAALVSATGLSDERRESSLEPEVGDGLPSESSDEASEDRSTPVSDAPLLLSQAKAVMVVAAKHQIDFLEGIVQLYRIEPELGRTLDETSKEIAFMKAVRW